MIRCWRYLGSMMRHDHGSFDGGRKFSKFRRAHVFCCNIGYPKRLPAVKKIGAGSLSANKEHSIQREAL